MAAPRKTFPAIVVLFALAGCAVTAADASSPEALKAEIPATFPASTELSLGDPTVQKQLGLNGEAEKLGFVVKWQNLSGGPQTIEAFRAKALDGGAIGDTPPIHAAFTNLGVKVVSVSIREKNIYQLASCRVRRWCGI